MGKKGMPRRWAQYSPIGQIIPETKIIAFKVPLKARLCQPDHPTCPNQCFTPTILLEKLPQLKTVIDLTNTNRYYNGEIEFRAKGIDHVKIYVEGGKGRIPGRSQINKFFEAIANHMKKYADSPEALIGVHCTHGVNRTGFFICKWMVEQLKLDPNEAIERFNQARGHNIERKHLVAELFKIKGNNTFNNASVDQNWRK